MKHFSFHFHTFCNTEPKITLSVIFFCKGVLGQLAITSCLVTVRKLIGRCMHSSMHPTANQLEIRLAWKAKNNKSLLLKTHFGPNRGLFLVLFYFQFVCHWKTARKKKKTSVDLNLDLCSGVSSILLPTSNRPSGKANTNKHASNDLCAVLVVKKTTHTGKYSSSVRCQFIEK